MRVSQVSLDTIATVMTGTLTGVPIFEYNKIAAPMDVARDTEVLLNTITVVDAPAGVYEIKLQEFVSYDTTRGKYELRFTSSTHTVSIPVVVHEPKDRNEVNPEFSRIILDHTGGDINFTVSAYHDTNNLMTVEYSDLSVEFKK
jgi:hypothetical protein